MTKIVSHINYSSTKLRKKMTGQEGGRTEFSEGSLLAEDTKHSGSSECHLVALDFNGLLCHSMTSRVLQGTPYHVNNTQKPLGKLPYRTNSPTPARSNKKNTKCQGNTRGSSHSGQHQDTSHVISQSFLRLFII